MMLCNWRIDIVSCVIFFTFGVINITMWRMTEQRSQGAYNASDNKNKARKEGLMGFAESYGCLYQAVSTSTGSMSDIDKVKASINNV